MTSGSSHERWEDALGAGDHVPTVLVADDEPVIQALVRVTLGRDERFQLLLARDGREALAMARERMPDVLMLDIHMPYVTGYDVCAQLRADPTFDDMVIIMLTAMGQASDVESGYEVGANEYFVKPFEPHELLAKVQEALGLKDAA